MFPVEFEKDYVSFHTKNVQAEQHQHYYIQITIALTEPFHVKTATQNEHTHAVIIQANYPHTLTSKGPLLFLLINPESLLGEAIQQLTQQPLTPFSLRQNPCTSKQLILWLTTQYTPYKQGLDDRIQLVLQALQQHDVTTFNVAHLARCVFLSESRLSHLFKEQVGISMRSYFVHEKLKTAFWLVCQNYSLTDAAVAAGFSSASHFTRTAKEKLGVTPRDIKKIASM